MPSIAIIGASADRLKFGNKAVRAYASIGWVVYPINPKEKQIEGFPCYPSIKEIPGSVDFASLYLPPQVVVNVLDDMAKKTKMLYFNPGTESEEAIKKAKELGLTPLLACSIRAIGVNPDEL